VPEIPGGHEETRGDREDRARIDLGRGRRIGGLGPRLGAHAGSGDGFKNRLKVGRGGDDGKLGLKEIEGEGVVGRHERAQFAPQRRDLFGAAHPADLEFELGHETRRRRFEDAPIPS